MKKFLSWVVSVSMEVHYKHQSKQLPLLIVDGDGPTLLGRDWLFTLYLKLRSCSLHCPVGRSSLNWTSLIFTKLDLSHAYLQLSLGESSKPLTTINTHKGLFQCTRLPFGISSTTAIFQRTMESLLRGLKHVTAYIDIPGRTR